MCQVGQSKQWSTGNILSNLLYKRIETYLIVIQICVFSYWLQKHTHAHTYIQMQTYVCSDNIDEARLVNCSIWQLWLLIAVEMCIRVCKQSVCIMLM